MMTFHFRFWRRCEKNHVYFKPYMSTVQILTPPDWHESIGKDYISAMKNNLCFMCHSEFWKKHHDGREKHDDNYVFILLTAKKKAKWVTDVQQLQPAALSRAWSSLFHLLYRKKQLKLLKTRKWNLLIKKKDTKASTCQIYWRVKPLSAGSAHFHASDRPITPLIIAFCRSVRLHRHWASRDQLNVLIQATHVHTTKKEDSDQTPSKSSFSEEAW